MTSIEADMATSTNVQLTVGSAEVMGLGEMGAGFHVKGTAEFLRDGTEYDLMKERYPFLTRALKITVDEIRQTI
jgi:hypothetical protein